MSPWDGPCPIFHVPVESAVLLFCCAKCLYIRSTMRNVLKLHIKIQIILQKLWMNLPSSRNLLKKGCKTSSFSPYNTQWYIDLRWIHKHFQSCNIWFYASFLLLKIFLIEQKHKVNSCLKVSQVLSPVIRRTGRNLNWGRGILVSFLPLTEGRL